MLVKALDSHPLVQSHLSPPRSLSPLFSVHPEGLTLRTVRLELVKRRVSNTQLSRYSIPSTSSPSIPSISLPTFSLASSSFAILTKAQTHVGIVLAADAQTMTACACECWARSGREAKRRERGVNLLYIAALGSENRSELPPLLAPPHLGPVLVG